MKLTFPRYIHGRLRTLDKKNVYGDLGGIAYSVSFSDDLRREVYKKVRPGLNAGMMRETEDVFGFFQLNNNDFVAAHFQLMELTEKESRGKQIFSEYYYVTLTQLNEINWNLSPIFEAFPKIEYYEQVETDASPLELDFQTATDWRDILNQFPVQVEAILVRYLSSSEKINIVASPNNLDTRLRVLCGLIMCLPQSFRTDLSFATLAKDTTESVRIFFSAEQGGYGQVIDWTAPTIPKAPGGIFSNWLVNLLNKSNAYKIERDITNLILPRRSQEFKTLGEALDLAIKYQGWIASRDDHLRISVLEQLHTLSRQIKEFSSIFTPQEAEEWLSILLIYVLKWTAYDIGTASISNYAPLFTNNESRQRITNKIIHEIFSRQPEENLTGLAGFITYLTEHGVKTNQELLLGFCEELLLGCLASEDCKKSLKLWELIKKLPWTNSSDWFNAAIDTIPQIRTKQDFIFILNDIGCPADKICFESLLALLERSSNLIHQLPETTRFLAEIDKYSHSRILLEQAAKCFLEIKSSEWLSTQILYSCRIFSDTHINIPVAVEIIGGSLSDPLLEHISAAKKDLLIVLVSYSIILIRIQQGITDVSLINKYLSFTQHCNGDNINLGLEILQNHWDYFLIENLEYILAIIENKVIRNQNLELKSRSIRDIYQKKLRARKIQDVFSRQVSKGDLGHITYDFVSEFCRTSDISAWRLFVTQIRRRDFTLEYRGYLLGILLENLFFNLPNSQLNQIGTRLIDTNLNYEADIFILWLFFRRGLYLDPSSAILNTIRLKGVHPFDAGLILSHKGSVDKKRVRKLVTALVRANSDIAEKLAGELDQYISKHPIGSLEVRLKALVSDINPEIVWIENCKLLSKQIRSELRKI